MYCTHVVPFKNIRSNRDRNATRTIFGRVSAPIRFPPVVTRLKSSRTCRAVRNTRSVPTVGRRTPETKFFFIIITHKPFFSLSIRQAHSNTYIYYSFFRRAAKFRDFFTYIFFVKRRGTSGWMATKKRDRNVLADDAPACSSFS